MDWRAASMVHSIQEVEAAIGPHTEVEDLAVEGHQEAREVTMVPMATCALPKAHVS